MRTIAAGGVPSGGLRGPLLAIATAAIVGACGSGVVAQGTTSGILASLPPAGSGAPSIATTQAPTYAPSPTPTSSPEPTSSPSPTPTASPSTSASPAPAPAATPLPRVAAAPAGQWGRIHWIAAGKVLPTEMTVEGAPAIFGWSRGYVAFAYIQAEAYTDAEPRRLLTSSSADGLRWTAPRPMKLSSRLGGVWIDHLVEGPAGLLAVGSDSGGTCSGPTTYDALWTSRDGVAWRPVTLPKAWLASTVWAVNGGSTGYIAGGIASDGETQALWLSRNGRSWHPARLPGSAGGKVVVDDVTAFAGGYVLVGAVVDPGGCGGPSTSTPSVWWSPHGRWWAHIPLGGPRPTRGLSITVTRITDRTVVATVIDGKERERSWVSTTGRRWHRLPASRTLPWLDNLTDARRAVAVYWPGRAGGPLRIASVGSRLVARVLRQSGPGPVTSDDSADFTAVLGPTGVLVVSEQDASAWLAVPTHR